MNLVLANKFIVGRCLVVGIASLPWFWVKLVWAASVCRALTLSVEMD